MNRCRLAALSVGLLCVSWFAHGAVEGATIRITVLDSETHTLSLDDSGVPKNCDGVNFDAYCHNSKTTQVTNTLLVQEERGATFRVACAVDSKWSRCVPLLKGASFDARRESRGLSISYVDDKGKLRKQLYTYVAEEQTGKPIEPAATGTAAASPTHAGSSTPQPGPAVKCSFSSTPSGADIMIDGQYTGSTPSVLNLSAGTHTVAVSLAGFAPWRRELTVSTGSELTVNAILEKGQ